MSYTRLYNDAGTAQGVLCSRDPDCDITFEEDSVRDCCVQEGVLSYQRRVGVEGCQSCYGKLDAITKSAGCDILRSLVYGWVEDIAPDNNTASPQSDITAEEGDIITLHIFHTKNGGSPPGGFRFTIETGGNATCNSFLFLNFVFLPYIFLLFLYSFNLAIHWSACTFMVLYCLI